MLSGFLFTRTVVPCSISMVPTARSFFGGLAEPTAGIKRNATAQNVVARRERRVVRFMTELDWDSDEELGCSNDASEFHSGKGNMIKNVRQGREKMPKDKIPLS